VFWAHVGAEAIVMAILRIEGVRYGVDDLATSTRFFSDVGLQPLRLEPEVSVFRTPVNQFVELRLVDDPTLPAAVGEPIGVREMVWGVDDERGLAAIRQELSNDRPMSDDDEGVLHSQDLTGYGIAFKVASIVPPEQRQRRTNTPTDIGRLNDATTNYGRAHPVRLMHIAMDVPKEGHDEANDFYLSRLGFKAVDRVLPVGTFMQCEGNLEHHNLLLVHRTDRASTNHLSMEVWDHDEVIEGGNYMTEQGWKEARRLGRHTIGSNVFRFFQAPCGGRIELAADMDRVDKSFKTRVWEKAPPHHLWILKFPGDAPDRH
jgi:catechol 2,3-dioxygenase-like lactoylglutathione lyase family enzyme